MVFVIHYLLKSITSILSVVPKPKSSRLVHIAFNFIKLILAEKILILVSLSEHMKASQLQSGLLVLVEFGEGFHAGLTACSVWSSELVCVLMAANDHVYVLVNLGRASRSKSLVEHPDLSLPLVASTESGELTVNLEFLILIRFDVLVIYPSLMLTHEYAVLFLLFFFPHLVLELSSVVSSNVSDLLFLRFVKLVSLFDFCFDYLSKRVVLHLLKALSFFLLHHLSAKGT